MKKNAFTLSEVLITLVIIGVIAVITLPLIMANHRRTEASAKLKKFYSMLCNASTRAKADGKNWEYWAESASSEVADTGSTIKAFSDEYLLPYLVYYKTEQNDKLYYIYLNDGTYFYVYKGVCLDFVIDINGERKPNMFGRDEFDFLYCPDSVTTYLGGNGKIVPRLDKNNNTREKALSACKQNGAYCSGILMIDGWEFKEDYPYNI